MVTEDAEQGMPLIPFDLFVKKCKGFLSITNPYESLVYAGEVAASPDSRRLKRLLLDPSGAALISIHRHRDGSWRGFKGDDDVSDENLLFKVQRKLKTPDRIELDVLLADQNGEESVLKMKGSVFWRSCTIYRGNSIVAQTSLMYTLGFRKMLVKRDKFRITMFPGFSDYAIIVGLVAVFLDGRK